MGNMSLQILETDQTIDALNAALAAKHVSADAVIAIHERPADPLQIGSGNRARYRVIYRA
jgi:hypothetical protein